MAVIETTRTTRPTASFGFGVQKLVAAIVAWNDARVTRNALSKLSDRELEDIGLARGDIERVVK